MLDVTKAIEESADTFFYQVAYMMGIDRINSMLSQFGYGKPTGIDLGEEYNGLLPSREWKQKVHKKAWYQGDTISVGIGQGYWIATPIQMVKAMVALINNGKVIAPHLLRDEESGKVITPYQLPKHRHKLPLLRPPTGGWCVKRCSAWRMSQTVPVISSFTPRLTALQRKVAHHRSLA